MTLHLHTNSSPQIMTAGEHDELGELLSVIDALTECLRAENLLLDRGLPPYAVGLTEAKEDLGDRFAMMWRDALDRGLMRRADASCQARLVHAALTLRTVGRANLERLERDLARSRQRVDAVLERVGHETSSANPLVRFIPAGDRRH